MADPTAFYETLAQAAGTVLAIMGGFVVSAAIRQRDLAEEARKDLVAKGREFQRALYGVDLHFKSWIEWYDTTITPRLIPQSATVHAIGAPPYVDPIEPGPFQLREDEDPVQWNRLREWLQRMRTRYSAEGIDQWLQLPMWQRTHLASMIHVETHNFPTYFVPKGQPSEAFNTCEKSAERDVRTLHAKMWAYEERLHAAEATVLPATLRWSVHLLAALAGFGVVLPMGLLSAYDSDGRNALLAMFAALLTVMLWLLAQQVVGLRRLLTLRHEDLTQWSLPSGFGVGTITPWHIRLRTWWRSSYKWMTFRQYVFVRPIRRLKSRTRN